MVLSRCRRTRGDRSAEPASREPLRRARAGAGRFHPPGVFLRVVLGPFQNQRLGLNLGVWTPELLYFMRDALQRVRRVNECVITHAKEGPVLGVWGEGLAAASLGSVRPFVPLPRLLPCAAAGRFAWGERMRPARLPLPLQPPDLPCGPAPHLFLLGSCRCWPLPPAFLPIRAHCPATGGAP